MTASKRTSRSTTSWRVAATVSRATVSTAGELILLNEAKMLAASCPSGVEAQSRPAVEGQTPAVKTECNASWRCSSSDPALLSARGWFSSGERLTSAPDKHSLVSCPSRA